MRISVNGTLCRMLCRVRNVAGIGQMKTTDVRVCSFRWRVGLVGSLSRRMRCQSTYSGNVLPRAIG